MKEAKMKDFAQNRKAHYEYFIEEKFSAGLVLLGSEVKSIREGKVNISDAYVSERNGELYIQNAHVSENKHAGKYFQHDPQRLRKLLLHKKEINKIMGAVQVQGYSATVLRLYADHNKIKAEIAIVKGKKQWDKKETIKKRDADKEISRAMKGDY
jgi:SsrA-binding protein